MLKARGYMGAGRGRSETEPPGDSTVGSRWSTTATRRNTRMTTSEHIQKLYPDVVTLGGLDAALSRAFMDIGSTLDVTGLPDGARFVSYGRIERGNRFSQVYIAAEKRLFLCDFWRDGVVFANGNTPDIAEAARAVDKWVADEWSIDDLQAIPFVSLHEDARAFDEGRETEERWTSYLRSIGDAFPELIDFVNAAAAAPPLRRLFPFTSLNRFCFSRCTGYPFTDDTPHVHPQSDGTYDVYSSSNSLIGNGDASTAVQLVIAHLPLNCGPAVRGTAETMNET